MSSIETALAIASAVIGWLLRSLPEWRKAWRMRELARVELDDPLGTDDPHVAAQNALITVERKRVRETASHFARPEPTGKGDPSSIAISRTRTADRDPHPRAGSSSDGNGGKHK